MKPQGLTYWLMGAVAVGLSLLTAACTKDFEATERAAQETGVPVGFDASASKSRQTRAGVTGPIDTEALKGFGPEGEGGRVWTEEQALEHGFGVMAVYTGTADVSLKTEAGADGGEAREPNFMWNQEVTWNDGLSDSYVTKWHYDPLKYWPNEATGALPGNAVDDQNNDTGNDPATTPGENGGNVSFFAYAPHVAQTLLPDDGGSGIVALTGSDQPVAQQAVTYQVGSMKVAESTDLLWSWQPNLNKMKASGEGHTNGAVRLPFIHALSRLTVLVQGVFDRAEPGQDWPEYPDEVDDQTKIFVDLVEILSPEVYTQGKMFLAPLSTDLTHPYWELQDGSKTKIVLGAVGTDLADQQKREADLNATIVRGLNLPSHRDEASEAKAEFDDELPEGVTKQEKPLMEDVADPYYLVLPTKEAEELRVRVVYHVVTYDERLTLNTPRYYSVVTNDIEATATGSFRFDINKTYTLRLLLGLTTVKFSVEVDDWAVPLVLDGEVRPWYEETHEFNVE